MGISYVRLSDVFNHNAAVRLHTGGMGGDVIHILQGGMNHMALIGIHWLTTLQFTSIRRLLLRHRRCLSARLPLQFTSIRRLLLLTVCVRHQCDALAVHIHPQIVTMLEINRDTLPLTCSSHPSADCYCNILCSASVPNTIYRATR